MGHDLGELLIEVVAGDAGRQKLVELTLPAGSTVADAIAASRLAETFSDLGVGRTQVGIWGRLVERAERLQDGDRVELYRPLELDPREARRLRAKAGV